MFSKGWCPYCKMAKSVLDETFGKGTWKEIDIEKGGCPPGPQIQSYMKKETGASSVSVFFAFVCSSGLNLKRRVVSIKTIQTKYKKKCIVSEGSGFFRVKFSSSLFRHFLYKI